jgi:hypothetical protein
MEREWAKRLLNLCAARREPQLPIITNAYYAFDEKRMGEDADGIFYDRTYKYLEPVRVQDDKDGMALVLLRPGKSENGRRREFTFSSPAFDEFIEDGILVRRYMDIERGRGISMCGRWDQGCIFTMVPGASFRMSLDGDEYLVDWRGGKLNLLWRYTELLTQSA